MSELHRLRDAVLRVHARIRDDVVAAFGRSAAAESAAAVARDGEGDTIYAIDAVGEETLLELCACEVAPLSPIVLIAEGLGGPVVLPRGSPESAARWRLLVDPIDGTRGLMYQKRSAWALTGVAQNRGAETRLSDVVLAVQTEIPLEKQHLSDVLSAIAGEGARAERFDRLTGEATPLRLRPSSARNLEHGFAQVARFFPGARDVLAAIDEEIARAALGPARAGKALCFEDQYLSSGGQLYELMAGHDRFVADLRPLMDPVLKERGEPPGLCCRPYDVCTELIARELGVQVVDVHGRALDHPLDVESAVAWVGYANPEIRRQVEPLLQEALKKRGLLPTP